MQYFRANKCEVLDTPIEWADQSPEGESYMKRATLLAAVVFQQRPSQLEVTTQEGNQGNRNADLPLFLPSMSYQGSHCQTQIPEGKGDCWSSPWILASVAWGRRVEGTSGDVNKAIIRSKAGGRQPHTLPHSSFCQPHLLISWRICCWSFHPFAGIKDGFIKVFHVEHFYSLRNKENRFDAVVQFFLDKDLVVILRFSWYIHSTACPTCGGKLINFMVFSQRQPRPLYLENSCNVISAYQET